MPHEIKHLGDPPLRSNMFMDRQTPDFKTGQPRLTTWGWNIAEVWQRWFASIATLITQLTTRVRWGTGSPQNVVTADIGTIYLRLDGGAGTTLYVKEADSGLNTGWVGK